MKKVSKQDLELLKFVKEDIVKQFYKIGDYHKIDLITIYNAAENIERLFDWIDELYEYDIEGDKSAKKAMIISMINKLNEKNIPMVTKMQENSIEFLMFSALQATMPEEIIQRAYLCPSVYVCDNKYRLSIALMDRIEEPKNGKEGHLIAGIECLSYDEHFGTALARRTTENRAKEIEEKMKIKLFQYNGKEIYANCHQLAVEFWKYIPEIYYM